MKRGDDRNGLWRWLAAAVAAGVVAVGCGLPTLAVAQGTDWSTSFADSAAGDPPGRVGRLSDVQGVVWLFHPEEGEWISAVRNRPVTSGDRLSTEAGARLELRIGSSALRLDGGTDIEIDRLDDEAIDIRLINGSLLARLRNDDAARDLLLSTDDGSFTPLGAGAYRLDRRDAASTLTVWSGQAAYNGPQSTLTVYQGQRAAFWIDANRRAQYSLGQPQFDSFASWSGELDRVAERAPATTFVSPEMTGAEDLGQYGSWTRDAEYGALWTPNRVAADWAPYSAGHWTWVSPWGWSWVDDAPWGFAPFHYGRWVVVRDRWHWAPGGYVARPVYSPALVGWIGGAGVSLTIGGGRGVGWFPLAPREAYLPPYRVSRGYVRGVNQPHFHDRSDVERLIQTPAAWRGAEYRNRKFHHGTTAIPIDAFNRGDNRGRIGVESGGRIDRGNVDRLPVTSQPDLPRPAWLGQRRDSAERLNGGYARDGRNPIREANRPLMPRELGGDTTRGDGRFERRRGEDGRPARDGDANRAAAPVLLPPSVQPPAASQRPFVQSGEPRADWPARSLAPWAGAGCPAGTTNAGSGCRRRSAIRHDDVDACAPVRTGRPPWRASRSR